VGKPFHYSEQAARIYALPSRSKERRRNGTLQVGELRIDPAGRDVRRGERKIDLSAKEFALLRVLATEPTRVFTRKALRDVWGFKLMGTRRRSPVICAAAFTRKGKRARWRASERTPLWTTSSRFAHWRWPTERRRAHG
jgi:hypothetical protein